MNRVYRVALIATALGTLSGVAVAGGDMHGQRAECRAARAAKFLPTYDVNRDGQLDRAERQKLHQARRQQMMARFDADRDGQLSEVEWVKARRERVAERFGRLDVNRDGSISRQEAAVPCSRLARHFDAVDQDRDGRVTAQELGAARMFGKHGKHGRGGFRPGPDQAPGAGDQGPEFEE